MHIYVFVSLIFCFLKPLHNCLQNYFSLFRTRHSSYVLSSKHVILFFNHHCTIINTILFHQLVFSFQIWLIFLLLSKFFFCIVSKTFNFSKLSSVLVKCQRFNRVLMTSSHQIRLPITSSTCFCIRSVCVMICVIVKIIISRVLTIIVKRIFFSLIRLRI